MLKIKRCGFERLLALIFNISVFALLRLVVYLSCMNGLVRFVQHVGVQISNHEQPNGKLYSLQTLIETCRQLSFFFYFYNPLTHDNKDPT